MNTISLSTAITMNSFYRFIMLPFHKSFNVTDTLKLTFVGERGGDLDTFYENRLEQLNDMKTIQLNWISILSATVNFIGNV